MVTKAIIPAAGIGSRFLPATKATPKEMLPVLNKPAVQYAVEEGFLSGIKNFIIVTDTRKRTIEDHFEILSDFNQTLLSMNALDRIEQLNKLIKQLDFTYVRQGEPLGLGHAIWKARHAVGNEHVAIMLPDDIITNVQPGIGQLIKIAHQEKCNVIAVREVPSEELPHYGVVSIKKQFSPNLFQIKELVEKPRIENAPSNLAIVGRYVLSARIFDMLEETTFGAIGEIQLTDAIQKLLLSGEKVFAYKLQGNHYDVGTPLGWLKANLTLALQHPEYSNEMLDYLAHLDKEMVLMQGIAAHLKKQLL